MEHKLIEGGGQYLPFARSRIKALRATGTKYATQRFVLPDAEISVRIVADQEFIHIKGSVLQIPMDSGVVDVLSILEGNPDAFLAGTLYETDYVARYNASFVLPESGEPPRRNPNEGSAGQLSGIVQVKAARMTGAVPIDAQPAESFRPAMIDDEDNPGQQIDDPADASLASKKRIAVLCPASMFTGKCRLYVQALYGNHLYFSRSSAADVPFELDSSSSRPALRINDRTQGLDQILLATSSGVYLDKTNGRHWLFTFSSGAKAYRLRASGDIEPLRKYLVTEGDNVIAGWSDEDREHLEAYILAHSLPKGGSNGDDGEPILSGSASDPYSMGYGWHWNWDGTVADAVTNEQYQQDAGNSAMESEWLRISITQPTPGRFTVTQTVVQEATRWFVHRSAWTIAEPQWSSLTLVKVTPQISLVSACEATIYAFYIRNELKTCSVRVFLEQGNPETIVDVNVNGTNLRTTGLTEGSRTRSATGSNFYSAVFTCGDTSTPPIPVGKVINYPSIEEVKNKVLGAWLPGFGPEAFGARLFTTTDDYGENRVQFWENSSLIDDGQSRQVSFDRSLSSGRDSFQAYCAIIFPVYDAEAVYLQSSIARITTILTNFTQHMGKTTIGEIGAFLVRVLTSVAPTEGYSRAQTVGAYAADGHHVFGDSSIIPDPTTTIEADQQVLVCRAGVIPATFTHLNVIQDNLSDTIPAGYYTRTGTRTEGDAVVIADNAEATGLNGAGTQAPVLVGWI